MPTRTSTIRNGTVSQKNQFHLPRPRGPRIPADGPGEGDDGDDLAPRERVIVQFGDGKARTIQYIASTTYWSADGRPISAAEFLRRLSGDLSGIIADEDELRQVWSDPHNREHLLSQLSDRGYDHARLDDIRRFVDGPIATLNSARREAPARKALGPMRLVDKSCASHPPPA
jgi:type I restriction enzyme R subunit